VFNSLFLCSVFNGNFCSLLIQFLSMAILYSPGWHEVLFTVMFVALGYLYMSISTVPCLFDMFKVKV
jgi:hypothetical protein